VSLADIPRSLWAKFVPLTARTKSMLKQSNALQLMGFKWHFLAIARKSHLNRHRQNFSLRSKIRLWRFGRNLYQQIDIFLTRKLAFLEQTYANAHFYKDLRGTSIFIWGKVKGQLSTKSVGLWNVVCAFAIPIVPPCFRQFQSPTRKYSPPYAILSSWGQPLPFDLDKSYPQSIRYSIYHSVLICPLSSISTNIVWHTSTH